MDKQQAKEKIKKLVDRYENLSETERKHYNEQQTKDHFIRPLFEALGWDFENDVWAETSVSKKRGDYAFKINGITKFFVEAKQLSVDLDELRWAEQAIWYAWHKSVPWAILTDFESIKVFNAEWDEQDPERNKVLEIKYQDYLTDERLWWLSKESVAKGEIDKHAEENYKKPKRASVDKQLVVDLLHWRDKLFSNFKGYNSSIKDDIISENVQRFLNRLIFIRTCEDRGFEDRSLQESVRNWEEEGYKNNELVKNLRKIFDYFDKTYDSKLFEERMGFDYEKFIVDDNILAEVIRETYKGSASIRWNFDDIKDDVLGNIYEQYLGFVQKKEKDSERIEKSKRKSQGIYYTPGYIVDYIVRNTLGEALKNKTSEEIKTIKVLDPACGSGSFLIRVYRELIEYRQNQKSKENRFEKGTHLGKIEKTIKQKEGVKLLSSQDKMDILRNNIYGVDLDEKAVEIAQLNLSLKTVDKKMRLPNLQHILCGNSLISGGESDLEKHFGKKWKSRKSFNWQEKFPEVFKNGGFDVVIGNPPYVNLANIKDEDEREYLKGEYKTAKNKSDLYSFFTERAITLLKRDGILGFIFSNSWLGTDSFSKFREYLVKNTSITQMVKLPAGVFEEATVTTVLVFLKKGKPNKNHEIQLFEFDENGFRKLANGLSYKRIINSPNYSFSFESELSINVPVVKLGQIAKFSLGIKTSDDKKFILDKKNDGDCYKLLRGKDVGRYNYRYADKWLWYKPDLMMKKVGAGPRKLEYFFRDKILFKDIAINISAIFDENKYLSTDTLSLIYEVGDGYTLKFILALLNSKFINKWYSINFQSGLHIKINELQNIPIPKIDFSNKKEKNEHDELAKLTDKMLGLNKELQKLDPELDDKEYNEIKEQIAKTDKKIDAEIYKLYGLTEEEIKIVETR